MTKNKYKTFWKRLLAGIIDGLVFIPIFIIEEIFSDINSKWVFIGFEFFYAICWMLYVVVGHGKYGQTVGKKAMKIKVFDLTEKNLISYKRAFFRESIWFLASISGVIYMIISTQNVPVINEDAKEKYYTIALFTSLFWLVIELVTMLSNNKRRAVHDYIAGSVVIDLREAERESSINQ